MRRRDGKTLPDQRKLEHAAFTVSVFGALLLLPPLINVFNVPERLFGVPLGVIYLFGVWIALIAGAVMVSWYLPRLRTAANGEDEERRKEG